MAKKLDLKVRVHGADVLSSAIDHNINESDIIDFSSNVNIFMSEINYKDILENVKNNINKYPDINYLKLRQNIANIYKVDKKYIIPGNGATELIYLMMKLPGFSKIGIFNPTFCEYERAAKISAKKIFSLSFNLLKENNKTELEKQIKDLDLIVICNPNNPTGEIHNIEKLLNQCKNNSTYLLIDETFIDFTDNKSYSLLDKLNTYPNLIILKAITKYYAMPGARLGYIFTRNDNLIKTIWDYKEPWTVNILAQEIVSKLEPFKIATLTQAYYTMEIIRLTNLYNQINIEVSKSVTNYLLLKLPYNINGSTLKAELLRKNKYLIRTCIDFIGLDDSYIRIAIKEEKNNTMLAEAIKIFIESEVN